jgi:uracil-DNA glycosylase
MSLDLDDRQRAMLQEMGLRVWAPARPAAAPPEADAPTAAAVASPLAASAVQAASGKPAPVPATSPAFLPPSPPTQAPVPSQPAPVTVAVTGLVPSSAALTDDLAQEIANCQACRLCQGRRAPVFDAAAAARRADWMVVGDPPEEADEQAGRPFAGASGQLLDNMLRALGLQARHKATEEEPSGLAYLSSVVKCRAVDTGPPEAAELAACHGFLQREIAQVRPRVILALGRPAALSLLQESLPEAQNLPLGQLRGRIHRVRGVPLVVSYPPAYLMRNQADKARAWADLCLARSALLTMPS